MQAGILRIDGRFRDWLITAADEDESNGFYWDFPVPKINSKQIGFHSVTGRGLPN
jgi:hypothetical protein